MKARSEGENKSFKISNKVNMINNGNDIVYRKVSRFIEQGFYSNFETLR